MYNSPDPREPHSPPPPAPAPYYANPAPSYPPAAAVAQPQAQAPTAADKARVAGIALLVSTGLLLIGALSKAWFTAGSGSRGGGVGLLGLEKCRGALCETVLHEALHDQVAGELRMLCHGP